MTLRRAVLPAVLALAAFGGSYVLSERGKAAENVADIPGRPAASLQGKQGPVFTAALRTASTIPELRRPPVRRFVSLVHVRAE